MRERDAAILADGGRMPAAAIARRHGVSVSTVRRILRQDRGRAEAAADAPATAAAEEPAGAWTHPHDLAHLGRPGQRPDFDRGGRRRQVLDALARWHWIERAAAAASRRERRPTADAARVCTERRCAAALTDAELEPLLDWIEREERIEAATAAGLDPRYIARTCACTVRTVRASQARAAARAALPV